MLMEMAGSRSCGGRAFQDNGLDKSVALLWNNTFHPRGGKIFIKRLAIKILKSELKTKLSEKLVENAIFFTLLFNCTIT